MGQMIDFHDPANYDTYGGRIADRHWTSSLARHIDVRGRTVADVGCGSGIYAMALSGLQPRLVVAVDFSDVALHAARRHCVSDRIQFLRSDARSMGMVDGGLDLVVERALIHHFTELDALFSEVLRVLRPGGCAWVQDRTPSDVLLPGSVEHLRGLYLEQFPRLKALELERRYEARTVRDRLEEAGFASVSIRKLWETRRTFPDHCQLRNDIVSRRGRSLLHALDDDELEWLARRISGMVTSWPVVERDRWTVWLACKRR